MSRASPAARSEFKVWRAISTRWADNDAYGHVNNTVYYEWFDSAVNNSGAVSPEIRDRLSGPYWVSAPVAIFTPIIDAQGNVKVSVRVDKRILRVLNASKALLAASTDVAFESL